MVCYVMPDLCGFAAALFQEHMTAVYLALLAGLVGAAVVTVR